MMDLDHWIKTNFEVVINTISAPLEFELAKWMSEQGGALVFMSGQKQRINIGFRKEGRELSVVTSFFPPEY